MSDVLADGVRARTGPGGDLEFTAAGAVIDVSPPPMSVEAQLAGAVYAANVYLRPSLVRAASAEDRNGREAVLIARFRYEELVSKERRLAELLAAGGGS